MQVVLQRVMHALVAVDGKVVGKIDRGYLLLVGIGCEDDARTMLNAAEDILKLRLMPDTNGKMGTHIIDHGGDILVVSQFTLYADFSKGNRPSFHRAAAPAIAESLIVKFINGLEEGLGKRVAQGVFGADMQVSLCNDGPVTVNLMYH